MVYVVAIVVYAVFVAAGIRFFQTVRMWDDNARSVMLLEASVRKPNSKAPGRQRKMVSVPRRTVLQDQKAARARQLASSSRLFHS